MKSFIDFLKEDASEGALLEEIIVSVWNGETPKTAKTIAPDAGEKIVNYLKSQNITGDKAYKLATSGTKVTPEWSQFWEPKKVPGSTKTPKTDIMIGDNRISLKMGDSQLMSGGVNESTATFYAACSKMDSLQRELLLPIQNKLSELAKTSVTMGKVDAALKDNSDPILTKANEVNNEVKVLMKELFTNNTEFRNHFVQEAMSGEVKFGQSAKARAEYVLSTNPSGEGSHLYTINDQAFVNKIAQKTTVTVRFKSTSVKRKKVKTGEYSYWSVVSLIVSKLHEELDLYNDQLLTENILTTVWNKVKDFTLKLLQKIFQWLHKSVKNVVNFFDFEPEVVVNNSINFAV